MSPLKQAFKAAAPIVLSSDSGEDIQYAKPSNTSPVNTNLGNAGPADEIDIMISKLQSAGLGGKEFDLKIKKTLWFRRRSHRAWLSVVVMMMTTRP